MKEEKPIVVFEIAMRHESYVDALILSLVKIGYKVQVSESVEQVYVVRKISVYK